MPGKPGVPQFVRKGVMIESPGIIETHTYAKSWGSGKVSCTKKVVSTTRDIRFESYEKVQTYDREEPWLSTESP